MSALMLDDDLDDYPLTEEIPPAPGRPMPDDRFFYGRFAEAVELLAQHTEADPVAHVAALYSYLGCMAGREWSVFGQPPTCNPVLVGDAGLGRKGTAWSRDVRLLFSGIDASLLPRVTGACSSEAGLVREVRDKSEKTDKDGVSVDAGVDDKRLWVNVSEFGKVFQDMKNPIFKLQECMCDLYDGNDQRISTSKGVMTATKPAVTFYGNITGEMLALRVDPNAHAGGILTRIMPVFVDRVRYYRGLVVPEDYKRECAAKGLVFAESVNRMRGKVGKGQTREIGFSREMQRWWRREGHEYLTTTPSHLSGYGRLWSSRRVSNFQRIATIIALAHETDEIGVEYRDPALSFVDYSMETVPYAEKEFGIASVATSRSIAMSPRARKWRAYMVQEHKAGRSFVPRQEIMITTFSKNLKAPEIDALEDEVPNLTYFMDRGPRQPTPTKCYYLSDMVTH